MSGGTSRSEGSTAREGSGVEGRLELEVAAGGRLRHLYQRQPLRCLFPRVAPDEPMTAVVANTAGGIVGGDRLTVEIATEADAALVVTGQAAEKVYRSAGAETRIAQRYAAGPRGWLEVLPQGTILFDGARLRRRTTVDLAAGARALVGEILVLGRVAMGERLTRGLIHDEWRVRRDGRLAWADALHLAGDLRQPLEAPSGFAGAVSLGTVIYAAEDAPARIDAARDLAGPSDARLRAGATVLDGLLLVRWLGRDAAAVRQRLGAFWREFRALVAEWPARLPAIWAI